MAIDVNVIFEEILALTSIRPILNSKKGICADKNVVISEIPQNIICDITISFAKLNFLPNG